MKEKDLVKKVLYVLLMIIATASLMFASDNSKPSGEPERQTFVSSTEVIVKLKDTAALEKLSPAILSKERKVKSLDLAKHLKPFYQVKKQKKAALREMVKQNTKLEKLENKLNKLYSMSVPANMTMDEVIAELQDNPSIEYVRPKIYFETSYIPTDTLYPQQWAHLNTRSEAAWNIEMGENSVVVAILDTGVDYTHEDLAVNIWHDALGNPGKDFVDLSQAEIDYYSKNYTLPAGEDYVGIDDDPMDFMGHGTHCAGITAAQADTKGIIGVAPNCKIMPIRAGFTIQSSTWTSGLLDEEATVAGILYAVENGANIISMSFGSWGESPAVSDALRYAYESGIVLVAAAGNYGVQMFEYPASLDGVIAVASTDASDDRSSFSDHGTWVDIAAPGSDILSTVPLNGAMPTTTGYEVASGTSMACPFIAGAAALLLSHNNTLTPDQVEYALKSATDSFPATMNEYCGPGRINLYKLLSIYTPIPEANITYPHEQSLISGYSIDITGTVVGDSYKLEIADSPYADTWTLVSQGQAVTDGVLGTLDAAIARDRRAYIKLTTYRGALEVTDVKEVCLYDNGPGFPKNHFSIMSASPKTYDLDGDGDKEIIIAVDALMDVDIPMNIGKRGHLFVLNPDGSLIWSKDIDRGLYGTPAIGDIDNDGIVEIVVSGIGGVYAFNADGSEQAGTWPKPHWSSGMPNIADLDKDGDLEIIIAASATTSVSDDTDRVYAWHHDGSIVTGWPQTLGGTIMNTTIADLDKDGYLEVLACQQSGTPNKLFVMRNDGTPFGPAWPKELVGSLRSAPVVADFDADGEYEIFGTVYEYKYENNVDIRTVHATLWETDGSVAAGNWPLLIPNIHEMTMRSIPVVGNLDADKQLEIVFKTRRSNYADAWHVINHDGTYLPGWPQANPDQVTKGSYTFQPAIADIDNDGQMEIIAKTVDKLLTIESDGVVNYNYTYETILESLTGSLTPYPAIDDIDNDGMMEIICANTTNYVTLIDVATPYSEDRIEWGSYRYDAANTGSIPIKSTASVEMVIDQDWGNGFTGYIKVKNISNEPIENWQLEFDWNVQMASIWDAVITSYSNNHYVISNTGWNGTIAPGQTRQFGFTGSPGNILIEGDNYEVNNIPAIVIE